MSDIDEILDALQEPQYARLLGLGDADGRHHGTFSSDMGSFLFHMPTSPFPCPSCGILVTELRVYHTNPMRGFVYHYLQGSPGPLRAPKVQYNKGFDCKGKT